MKEKKQKVLLIVLCSLLVIVIGVIAFILINGKMEESDYRASISQAEKYLQENNYEDAIVAYKTALEIDPDSEDAYLGLAEAYEGNGEKEEAIKVLNTGLARMDSPNIQNMLNRLNGSYTEKESTVAKEKKNSEDIAWNTSFTQKIVSYDFDSFKDEYGSVKSAKVDDDGYLEVVHKDLNAVCYYKNTSDNKEIVDLTRKTPYATGMPTKIRLNNLLLIFRNWEGYVSLDRLQMLVGKKIEPVTEDGRTLVKFNMGDYTMKIETNSQGTITSANAWNEITLPDANSEESSKSSLSGVVLDAVTGDGVENATLIFEAKDGSVEKTSVKTNSQGAFKADLEPATYKITIKADGYVEEEFSFRVEKDRTYSGEQFTISPELASGSARIVLEWNAEPVDLDSYLKGTTDSGKDVFVNYSHKIEKSDSDKIAELDLDDVDGYGPETTTLYNLKGKYTFFVVDFRATGTMAEKGATVKVYLPGKPVTTIKLDSNCGVENIWNVCEIDHGEVKVLNNSGDDMDTNYANK